MSSVSELLRSFRHPGFGSVILVATFVGVFDVAETTLAKSFVYDVVGPDDAVNGMALEQLANKLFGVIGGVTTGIVMSLWGGVGAFVMMSIVYGCSAFLLMLMPRVAPTAGSFREVASLADGEADDEQPAIWESMLQLLQTPSVLVFAVIALAGEVFAYSHEALAPSFARDILNVGERGLGNLVAARNAGGVVGLLMLGSMARKVRPERLLPAICVGFGTALVAFSMSTSYTLSLALMGIVGIAWASVDALLPTVMQQNVDNADRGAVVGVWNLSRGFGPLSQLEMGLLGATVGVAATQAINGAAFALSVLIVAFIYRRHQARPASS